MVVQAFKDDLSTARQRLIDEMQRINFGKLTGLCIHKGEPHFDPPPLRVYELKFGGDNGPRPELSKTDYALKDQVHELFAMLEDIGDGVVSAIEIKHGLPFRMIVEEVAV